jgi:hypothetical protein
MPAVLAQATYLVLIYSLAVWTGCALLITALLPRPAALAKIASKDAPVRILLRGLPISFSLVLFSLSSCICRSVCWHCRHCTKIFRLACCAFANE